MKPLNVCKIANARLRSIKPSKFKKRWLRYLFSVDMAKKQQREKEEKTGKKRKFEEVQEEVEEASSEFEEPPPGFVGESEGESEEEESQEKVR